MRDAERTIAKHNPAMTKSEVAFEKARDGDGNFRTSSPGELVRTALSRQQLGRIRQANVDIDDAEYAELKAAAVETATPLSTWLPLPLSQITKDCPELALDTDCAPGVCFLA